MKFWERCNNWSSTTRNTNTSIIRFAYSCSLLLVSMLQATLRLPETLKLSISLELTILSTHSCTVANALVVVMLVEDCRLRRHAVLLLIYVRGAHRSNTVQLSCFLFVPIRDWEGLEHSRGAAILHAVEQQTNNVLFDVTGVYHEPVSITFPVGSSLNKKFNKKSTGSFRTLIKEVLYSTGVAAAALCSVITAIHKP